jgi:competence protein ComGC
MSSRQCPHCGLVSWAQAVCKGCGQPYTAPQSNWQPPAAAPNYEQQYEQGYDQHYNRQYDRPYGGSYGYAEQQQKRTGLAVASLVVGIIGFFTLGLFFVGAVVGLVLGIVALRKVKTQPDEYGGHGVAVAGVAMNALSLLTVVPIGIIAAIAIPNLLAARRAANEAGAIYGLRVIAAAEEAYHEEQDRYATLEELAEAGMLEMRLVGGVRSGYRFNVAADANSFVATATPTKYPSNGVRSFYVSDDGVLHGGDLRGLRADADAPVIETTPPHGPPGPPALRGPASLAVPPMRRPAAAR